MLTKKYLKSQMLVELLIVIGLLALIIPALLTGYVTVNEAPVQTENYQRSEALLNELVETTRIARDNSWNAFAVNGIYHPVESSNTWALASGPELVDVYTRQIQIDNVNRDSNGLIVSSGGTLDPSTKKITATVSWATPRTSQISTEFYLTRFLNNNIYTRTSEADFLAGTTSNTTVKNNAGGEVELATSSSGSWTSPNFISSIDLTSNSDGLGVFAMGGYLYVGSGNNFFIYNVSNPASPSLLSSTNTGGLVNDIFVSGNYAFVANGANELMIYDITNKSSPNRTASLNLSGNADGKSVVVVGNYAYIGRNSNGGGPEFEVVNVSNKSSPSSIGTMNISGNVTDVAVSGSYAYLSTGDSSNELIIVNISNPSSPNQVGSYNVSSPSSAYSVAISGSTIYLTTALNGSGEEFYAFDVSNPASPSLLGSYEVGVNANQVELSGNYALVAVDSSSNELLVLDISNSSSISMAGVYDFSSGANRLSIDGSYVYVTADMNNQEVMILEGGGSSGYQTSGTFESPSFNAGASASFNYLTIGADAPANTTITLQIATNNNNTTWTYVGPDGTAGTSYSADGSIPLNYAVGQYFRFKATLTGDGSVTPTLNSVIVNYSP